MLDRISSLVHRLSPDVAALQEADVGSHWNHRINAVEHVREKAGYAHAAAGIHNIRHGKKPLAYGNAVISKGEILSSETLPFGINELGEKGCMIAEIVSGGIVHTLINLHLDYKSRAERIGQVEIMLARIESSKLPCQPLICGDFNSTAGGDDDAVRRLHSVMKRYDDYTLWPRKGATFPSPFPVRGLDFIFVPSRYRVLRCEIIRSLLSDHRPVMITLEYSS
jgi:endonuclease/exonuclease/phosphatase family metal-dependent hydrolase